MGDSNSGLRCTSPHSTPAGAVLCESWDVKMWTEAGAEIGPRSQVCHNVPLRVRWDDKPARLAELLVKTEWHGGVGFDISDCHDRIDDCIPADGRGVIPA